MTPERYAEITRLCQAALELNSSQRTAFLAQACAEDEELRREVEELLAADEAENSFIDQPALHAAAHIFAHEQSSLSGTQFGNYHIQQRLGAGGMGEVYLAEDVRLKRKVALKILPAAFIQDAERVRRFEQEAQAASALNHPNIITIHDLGVFSAAHVSTHFIATEYVNGQTLRQLLQRGPLAATRVIEIAVQLADALAAAHAAGIIHRDIKPENIMLRPDGYVKVLDFGLAKLTETNTPHSALRTPHSLTEPGRVMGTISYMSPEQALGHELDARTDLFSLGIVFYELLTGIQPFKKDSEAATYNAILNTAPPVLSSVQAPPALAAIVTRALEKDPELRYQTAADLRAALKLLQRDSASHSAAQAIPSVSQSMPHSARRWLAPALVALGILALVIGWYGFTRRGGATPASAPGALQTTVTQLTAQAGRETQPRLSPDGQSLLYASMAAGNWDIWVRPLNGGPAVNLTKDNPPKDNVADDMQPAYSFDGQQIAFRSERAGGGIFVMSAAGGAAQRLTAKGFYPAWSPDGSEIVYAADNFDLPNVRSIVPSPLEAVSVATGATRLITPGDAAQPNWSPSGARIAYWGVQKGGQRDLWTIAAAGGAPVPVTDDAAVDWNPVWSPDGRYLYFASDRGGSMNLWRIAIDEASGQVLGAPAAVTTPSSYSGFPSFAADGKRLVYVQISTRYNLQKIGFDPQAEKTSGAPVWLTQGTKPATQPSLSPDGQWLAYDALGDAQEDLRLIKTDGSGEHLLTNDPYKDRAPRWSPDSRQIVFLSDRTGRYEAWRINADGSGLQQLTWTTGPSVQRPLWSPDGRRILCNLGLGGVPFLITVDKPWQQQTPQPLSPPPAAFADDLLMVMDWSADGAQLLLRLRDLHSEKNRLAVYSFATGQYELLNEFGAHPTWFAKPDAGRQRVLFEQNDQAYLIDSLSQRLRSVFSVAPQRLQGINAAPDGRTLYYCLVTTESDLWLLQL